MIKYSGKALHKILVLEGLVMIRKLDDIIEKVKGGERRVLAVAAAEDAEVLSAVHDAMKKGIIKPVLIGDVDKIKALAEDYKLEFYDVEMIQADSLEESASMAVKLVSDGKADFLMKGLLDTAILLKAVLNKEYGLRTDSLLSHVMLYEMESYHKLLILSDGGMNIAPSYDQKFKICKNAIDAAKALGMDVVKVASLAAKEKVNEKMIATVEARQLQEDCKKGMFGENVVVEGPLAFDIAVSKHASEIKGFESEVSGDVDVLLVPNIEVGNGIGKSFTYMANAKSAGVVMGAKVPVVLVSRADTHESKLYSIGLGALIAGGLN